MFLRKMKYLVEASRNQWLPEGRLKSLQLNKLKFILNYAYQNSEFYRERFDACGVSPSDINSIADIKKLPMITKEEIRENLMDILTIDLDSDGYKEIYTSGSCGDALKVVYGERSWDYTCAVYARNLFAMGCKPWWKIAFYWEPDPLFMKHATAFYHNLAIMKKYWIFSSESTEEQLEKLKAIDPDVIFGFPSSIKLVCRLIENKKLNININPKIVISSYEILAEETRKYMESVLKAPVYNWYSSTEFMGMAGECKKREGLHINSDSILVEVLKNGKKVYNELGELVVTGLEMEAMPLIRYQLKDFGVLSKRKCSCGRSLPLLRSLEGRDDDFIILPNHKVISPRGVVATMDSSVLYDEQIRNFRVIQKFRNYLVVKIVKGNNYSLRTPKTIKKSLLDFLKKDVEIKVELVDKVEKNRRGKLRFVISEVDVRI